MFSFGKFYNELSRGDRNSFFFSILSLLLSSSFAFFSSSIPSSVSFSYFLLFTFFLWFSFFLSLFLLLFPFSLPVYFMSFVELGVPGPMHCLLQKPHGYHLDLFVLAFLIGITSILGLPWFVAATVRAITHVRSLIRESELRAPGERSQFLGVRSVSSPIPRPRRGQRFGRPPESNPRLTRGQT